MNIFKKYKSHIIAASGSLMFSGTLILLLLIRPGGSLFSSDLKQDSEQELAIQFQLLENLEAIQPTTKTATTEEVKTVQHSATSTNTESPDDLSQNEEDAIQPVNTDSMLVVEMKKTLEDIKADLPEDTLPKEEIVHQEIKKTQEDIAKSVRLFNDNRKFYYDNYRMITNLKVIYPYVVKVKEVVDNLNAQLARMTNNQEKHKLIKKTEKELFTQFEKDVRKMSYTQGKLMLKLISRETNESAYGLIKTYKGGLPATFWYTVGLVFQEDLKAKYDSIGEDKKLEMVVRKYKKSEL